MASRLQLHDEFIDHILDSRNDEESRVYFNAPASKNMRYPCIRYSKAEPDIKRANNKIYKNTNKYEGVIIDYDPDSEIPDKLLNHFEMCSIGRSYTADNLNHTPFSLYY